MRILVLLNVLSLIVSCNEQPRRSRPQECCRVTSGDWSYYGEPRSRTDDKWSYDFRLTYDGRVVNVPGSLLTPLGCFSNRAATDPEDASGWKRDEEGCVTSTIQPRTFETGQRRFIHSASSQRPSDVPRSWVYWTGIKDPLWLDPSLLFARDFVDAHRQLR
jgi:hypothetical protein